MKTFGSTNTMKDIAAIMLSIGVLAGCTTTANKPLSSIKIVKIQNSEDTSCLLKLSIFNHSTTPWREFQPYLILKNSHKQVVGQLIANTPRYIEPGHGLAQQKTVTGTRCEEIYEVVLLEFTYVDNAGTRYKASNSRVAVSLE